MLKILLIIGDIVAGFVAAYPEIVKKIPELEKTGNALTSIKKYIGSAVLIISVLNIFNFWTPVYPKLLLLAGLLVGFVLSVDWLEKINIKEETKDNLVNIAQKMQIPVGIFALVVGILKVIARILNIIESIL
jgi:hypothetical protein